MWDGWEKEHGSTKNARASLAGFERDFNKASTKNWGSPTDRGPTLGLRRSSTGKCEGLAFELPDEARLQVMDTLERREGESFGLEEKDIELESGERVKALVPVNDTSKATYIGNLTLAERTRMAKCAQGSNGTCASYVKGIHDKLTELGISDQVVRDFWSELSRE